MREKLKQFGNSLKKYENICFIIVLIALVIVAVIDCLTIKGKINPIIYVSESYIDSVFAAVITVITLSISIFSLIISIADSSVLGIKLKEIISFKASPIQMKRVIVNTVILTISSVLDLSLNMNTSMTWVAVISVAYIGYISYIFYKMVTDNDFIKKLFQIEIENHEINLTMYGVSWLSEYKKAIMDKNKPAIELYSEILSLCLKKDKDNDNDIIDQILIQIPNMLYDICKYYFFVEAYNLVCCINGKYAFDYNKINEICHDCINRIQFYSEEDLLTLNFQKRITDILKSNFSNNLKVKFIYDHFDAIIHSSVSEKTRIKIFENGLNEISSICDKECDFVKSKILLRIFVNHIIASDNFNFSKKICGILIKSLYMKNLSDNGMLYISVIANIFRCVYFYGFINFRVFNDTQRENIKSLASYVFQLDWLTQLSIDKLCRSYDEKILDYYINELLYSDFIFTAECDEEIDYLMYGIRYDDLFYETRDSCEPWNLYMLWDEDERVKFIFWYFLSRSTKEEFPLISHIDSFIEKYPNQRKKHTNYIEKY